MSSRNTSRGSQQKATKRNAPGASNKRKQKNNANSEEDDVSVYQTPREEMISNGLHYCLVMQHAKLPIRRVDLAKIAFDNQSANFALVLKELEDVLEEDFGLRLIGVNDGDNSNTKKLSSSFILVSRFFKMTNTGTEIGIQMDVDTATRNSLLFMILTSIFMSGHNIGEDVIWKIMSELELYPKSCTKREDLHRFLKSAYILPLYLTLEQVDTGTDDGVRFRYGWGFRAEMEMSKYKILQYAAKQFPGKKPVDFANQFAIISKSAREQKLVTKDGQDEYNSK